MGFDFDLEAREVGAIWFVWVWWRRPHFIGVEGPYTSSRRRSGVLSMLWTPSDWPLWISVLIAEELGRMMMNEANWAESQSLESRRCQVALVLKDADV